MYCIVKVTNVQEEINQEGRPGQAATAPALMERVTYRPHYPLLLGGKLVCTPSLLQVLSPIYAETASLLPRPSSVH